MRRMLARMMLGVALITTQACAQDGFQDGVHYQTLKTPVVTADPARVEVMELFWYGCPHCDALDPALKRWAEQLPEDVQFQTMPVVFGRSWEMHARMYWVAKSLNLLDEMHAPIFNALHREGRRLQSTDEVVDFFAQFGADPTVVRRELTGFATESALRLADARVRNYGINGVPALVVDGRYVTSVSQAGGEAALFEVLDHLIAKARNQ